MYRYLILYYFRRGERGVFRLPIKPLICNTCHNSRKTCDNSMTHDTYREHNKMNMETIKPMSQSRNDTS